LILFLLLLLLTFGVTLYFLRPSRTEAAIQRQLAGITEELERVARSATILKEQALVLSPWVVRLVKRLPGSSALEGLIEQAGSNWPVPLVLLFSVLATPLAGWLTSFWMPGVVLPAAAGVAVGLLPYVYLYFLRRARFRGCDDKFPGAIDLMARALRAGHSVHAALEMVGQEIGEPVGSEFRRVHKEQTLGLPLREAIENLVKRLPRQDVRFFATALLVQKETGGNLAQILDKAAEVARERARLRGQLRVYSAQGRLTGWVLCLLPFILFALIDLVNSDYERVLFSDPLGVQVVKVGVGMMLLGILVIRKIVDVKV
jgi:tight adherence protein B